MTRRRRTSPRSRPSSTRSCRRSGPDEDLDDYLSTIPDNYDDCQDDISGSDNEPVRRPSKKAIGKHQSKDLFTSTLGKQVAATQLTPTSAQPLHPECREVCIVSEEVDEREPAPLASKNVYN
jgi:hypothetical protein